MRRVLVAVGLTLCRGGGVGACGTSAGTTAEPASFTGTPPRSAVQGYDETQQVLQRRQFSPPR